MDKTKRKHKKKLKNLALIWSIPVSVFVYLGIAEQSKGSYTVPQIIVMALIIFWLLLFAYAQTD